MAQLCQLSAIGFLRKITAEIYFFKNRTKAKTNKKTYCRNKNKNQFEAEKALERESSLYVFEIRITEITAVKASDMGIE